MNKSIILLSGGLDSLVSLAILKNELNVSLALTFNYGQKSFIQEYNASKKIAQYYNINHRVINLDFLAEISDSSLTSNKKIPNLDKTLLDNAEITKKSASSVWIPNRNGLFINIAACFADAQNYSHIIIGANKEESANFKDNSVNFIEAVNLSIKNSTMNKIEVTAPLINFDKKEIIKQGLLYNAPLEQIYSCYDTKEKHCGKCESCLRLKRALELNNREDIISKLF